MKKVFFFFFKKAVGVFFLPEFVNLHRQMIQVFVFSVSNLFSPRGSGAGPARGPAPAEALFQVRREAGGSDAAAAGRAGHVPRRGGLEGLAEGVDAGEADGGSWSWRGRNSNRGSSSCCCCFGVSSSFVRGRDRRGAKRRSRSGSGGIDNLRAPPLQRRGALQVDPRGRPRRCSGPPGAVRLEGDVGDEFCFFMFFFVEVEVKVF